MEHIDVSNQSLAAQEAEIYRFLIRTTDLKDPVEGGDKSVGGRKLGPSVQSSTLNIKLTHGMYSRMTQ